MYIAMTVDSLHVKINEEYVDLLPKLSEEEYESLKSSIRKNGLRFLNKHPIIVNNQGVILDGYHRFKACQELGLESKLDLDTDVNKQNGGSH
jgi:ParB-like chromosome segregation protein Spo0J